MLQKRQTGKTVPKMEAISTGNMNENNLHVDDNGQSVTIWIIQSLIIVVTRCLIQILLPSEFVYQSEQCFLRNQKRPRVEIVSLLDANLIIIQEIST